MINTVFAPPPVAPKNAWIAVDLEMIGLPDGRINRPKPECFGIATFTTADHTCYVCSTPEEVQIGIDNTMDAILVFHNAMFDITHIRSIAKFPDRKKLWDTMLVEKILYNGYYSEFGLQDLAARYLNVSMDKSGQKNWAKAKTRDDITEAMIEYAVEDGWVTVDIAQMQYKLMQSSDFGVWTMLDRPAIWAVQSFRGFPIDLPKFQGLTDKNLTLAAEYKNKLSFNPNSPQQVVAHFKDEYGISLDSSGEEDLLGTKEILSDLTNKKYKKLTHENRDKAVEEIDAILKVHEYTKRAGTYGTSILEAVEYQDEVPVIFGSYNITGAMTGRMCVSKDTKLKTSKGVFAISDLDLTTSSNLSIMSHTGKENRILNKFYKGKEEMYKVISSSGNSIICTKGHIFLTPTGWKHLYELQKGSPLYTVTYSDRRKPKNSFRRILSRLVSKYNLFYEDFSGRFQNFKKSIVSIIEVLFNFISRGNESKKARGLFKSIKRTRVVSKFQEGSEKSISREGRINSENFSRKNRIWNSKRIGSSSSNYKKGRKKLSSGSSIQKSKIFNRTRMGNARNFRSIFSGNYGRILSSCGRSSNCIQYVVSGFCRNNESNNSYKKVRKTIRLLQNKRSSKERSHFLEIKRIRNATVSSSFVGKYFTYSRISLGKIYSQRIYSRCFYSTKYFNRDKWFNSSSYSNDKEGRREKQFSKIFRIFSSGIFYKGRRESFRLGSLSYKTDHIISIESVGMQDVWDIEVETDHSYVAQGFINHNSSDSPNMQNIPSRGEDSVYRECFIPYPGEVLIVSDYSSQEPRITSVYAEDDALLAIFCEDKDIYIEMASRVFKEQITKKDPRRGQMKAVFLGMTYGLSKYGLSKRENISIEEAEALLDRTFKMFPQANNYTKKARKNRKFTLTKGGRKFWLNPYSNQVERHALNAPIQGTASDQMKLALSYVYNNWPTNLCKYGVVAVVHDEMVASVPKEVSKEIAEFIRDQMVKAASTVCPGVPFKADVKICESWAEK